jgi:hypothetical protein
MPTEQRAVRFDPNVMAEIEKIAKDEGRTVANAIRRLVDEALAARAKSSDRGESSGPQAMAKPSRLRS